MTTNSAVETTKTLEAGLFGNPIKHSLSPAMQSAGYAQQGILARFNLWEIDPRDLPARIEKLREPQYLGAMVTVPFKREVLNLVDEIDPHARQIGAINTISKREGRLIGHNTDEDAFMRSLVGNALFNPTGKTVTLLGAGGAARAVAFGLCRSGVKQLNIVNRNRQTAELLATELAGHHNSKTPLQVELHDLEAKETMAKLLKNSDLLVNATSFGLQAGQMIVDPTPLPKHALVFDLMYRETDFLKAAKNQGLTTIDGFSMLVHANCLCFTLMTGLPAHQEVMRKAGEGARNH